MKRIAILLSMIVLVLAVSACNFLPLPPIGNYTGSIIGKLIDSSTNLPIAGAMVTLSGPSTANATSTAQGSFSFSNLAAGNYTLTITAANYQNKIEIVQVGTGASDVQIEMVANNNQTPTGSITGKVVSPANQPISNATVTLQGQVTNTVNTNTTGDFSFTALPAGSYTITVQAAGYQNATKTVAVTTVEVPVTITMTPVSPADTGSIVGRVVNASAQPIANADISLQGTSITAKTDASGNFTIGNLVAGTYTVVAAASGYQSASQTVTVSTTAVSVSFTLTAVPVNNIGTITGVIKNANNQTPIAGATVALHGTTMTFITNSQGAFSFYNVPQGTYTLEATCTGFYSATTSVTVTANQTTNTVIMLTPQNTPVQKGTITGKVFEFGNNLPIVGAQVDLKGLNTAQAAITAADGSFIFSDVNFGTYTLTATKTGYQSNAISISLNQPTANVNIGLNVQQNPVDVTAAKNLVNSFKTSLYQLGSVYATEQSLIQNHIQNQFVPFAQNIAPYMEEMGFGLQHMQVTFQQGPGTYIFQGFDQYGDGIYTQTFAGDPNAETWVWTIDDPIYNLSVNFTAPRMESRVTSTPDGLTWNVDLTNITFNYSAYSTINFGTTYNAIYAGTIALPSTNIQLYTFTHTDEYTGEITTINVSVPTGPTAVLKANVEPDQDLTQINGIEVNAAFDIQTLLDSRKLTLDGSIVTPVTVFTGGLSLEIPGTGNIIEFTPTPFTITGYGTLSNGSFSISGDFGVNFAIVNISYYGDIYQEPVPAMIYINGSYASATANFTGHLGYQFVNISTYDFNIGDSPANYPQFVYDFDGTLVNGTNTYYLNFDISTSAFDQTIVQIATGTPLFTLNGTMYWSYTPNAGKLTEVFLVDGLGVQIYFKSPALPDGTIGAIKSADGTVLARISSFNDVTGDALAIRYVNGDAEIIPLNPTVYIP